MGRVFYAVAVAESVQTLETESANRVDDLRSEIEARIIQEIEVARDEYRPARIVGTLALTVGLALITLANFI